MNQKLLNQYKEVQITPMPETLPQNVLNKFKNKDTLVDTNQTTPMHTLLEVYFSPLGDRNSSGVGIATRIKKGEYAFSSVNCKLADGVKPDILIEWENGKITSACMSAEAADDFNDLLSGKIKKRVSKNTTIQKDLLDLYMDDPQKIADTLRVYSKITGDGDENNYGIVTGVTRDTKAQDQIDPSLFQYLKEVEKVPYGKGVLRVFEVIVPKNEKTKYTAFQELQGKYSLLKQAEDQLDAVSVEYSKKIDAIKSEADSKIKSIEEQMKKDHKISTTTKEIEALTKEIEALKEKFNA